MDNVDLERALTSFNTLGAAAPKAEPPSDPVEDLAAALSAVLTRARSSEVVLEQEDTVARSRQAYTLAILKLLDYLALDPKSLKERGEQAKVALGYIRHIETSRLAALQIGRSTGDAKLATAVATLRAKVDDLASKKAAVMNEVEERRRLKLLKGA